MAIIAADCRADAALTMVRFAPVVQGALGAGGAKAITQIVTSDDLPQDESAAAVWAMPATKPNDLAILQYTSGSTRTPRGVMLTHANLLHNSAVISDCFGHSEQSRGVIWLPHYHDMGLIGGILQTLFTGLEVTLMAPAAFVQRPRRWLEAITRYGGTTSGGPNSAYELCLRAIPPNQRNGLDLSTWDLAFNGAEPVRPQTLQAFTEAFGACGFRGEAFYPCYGLAEASLLVSGGEKGRLARVHVPANDDASTGPLVSCGPSRATKELLIVDPATRTPCAAGVPGEIWVRGRSVGLGYFGDDSGTEKTFGATLAGDATNHTYLRTGDLGVLDHAGELFITGRLKDLIVVAGANHHPQDIEWTMQHAHDSLQIDSGAAFAAETGDGAQRLFLIQELRREDEKQATTNPEPIFAAIRTEIVNAHGLRPASIALLPAGALMRTSSGKVRRRACRTAFLSGTIPTVATWHEPAESSAATEYTTPTGEAASAARASNSPEAMELFAWWQRSSYSPSASARAT